LSAPVIAISTIAGVLGAGALYQLIAARRTARRFLPPGRMIEVEGQRLHAVCSGDGRPAVLFESGVAASSLSWSRVRPAVARVTRACAYDRAGLAWSDPAGAPRTLPRILAELRGVLAQASGGDPAVLVGHSFGAFLACAYASAHPADVAGLVLIDPPTDWQRMTPERARQLRGGIQLSRLGGLLASVGFVRASLALLTGGAPAAARGVARLFGPTAARVLDRLVGEVRKLPPEVHPIVQAHWCQPKCFRAMAGYLGAMNETAAAIDAITALPDVPLTVVSGGDQPPGVLERHRALARLAPAGRHVIAGASGHWIQFDQPDLIVSIVCDVVDRIREP
jgi:pimeloyl-ACP methyl ester carboxylesterase